LWGEEGGEQGEEKARERNGKGREGVGRERERKRGREREEYLCSCDFSSGENVDRWSFVR